MGFCILSAFRGEETPAGQDMRPGGCTVKADAFFAPDSFLIISFALRKFEKRREKCKIEEEKTEVRQWRLHVEVSGKKFFIYMIRTAKFAATGKADGKSAGTKKNASKSEGIKKSIGNSAGRKTNCMESAGTGCNKDLLKRV